MSAGFAGAGQAGDRQGGSRANQQISISGQRREFNYYTLDGVDNTDVNFNTYIFLPSVDALEEFKVQTGIYSAEFGRAAGQVNVVTKSGSNAFHGTVFEFHRNDKFDARPYAFTAAQAAAAKPDFRWHQFGYTATGPIASNRLFFMSNYEGYKDDKTFLTPFTVPTAAMRSGDFSALATSAARSRDAAAVAGTSRACQPFTGQPHSDRPHQSALAEAARVLSRAERGGHGKQLHLAAGSRHRPQAVPRRASTSSRARSRTGWAGTAGAMTMK